MKALYISIIASTLLLSTQAQAADNTPKRTLKANSTEVFNLMPGDADTLAEMFEKGEIYGRLRLNTFKHDWGTEVDGKYLNSWATALGAMLHPSPLATLYLENVYFVLITARSSISICQGLIEL